MECTRVVVVKARLTRGKTRNRECIWVFVAKAILSRGKARDRECIWVAVVKAALSVNGLININLKGWSVNHTNKRSDNGRGDSRGNTWWWRGITVVI